jgi:branched-subunit amino acid aminotransferase/4-amino-4-deoxychorismate lyase
MARDHGGGLGIVYLNGRFVAAGRAAVSAFDRGLLYGDGLFETVRAYRGAVFALEAHLERLHASAAWLGFEVPALEWRRIIGTLLRRNRLVARDASVRITLTRGPGRPGLLPPPQIRPTVFMMAAPIDPAIVRAQQRGVPVVLLPFARAATFAGHKLLDYVPAIRGRLIAQRAHAFEALYVDTNGRLSEGTTSNLFLVRRGQLLTPPLDPAEGVLPGVTRRVVIELARVHGLAVRERHLRIADLESAHEVFCTSSLIEVMPIVRAGACRIATGRPGAITRSFQRWYGEAVVRATAGTVSTAR